MYKMFGIIPLEIVPLNKMPRVKHIEQRDDDITIVFDDNTTLWIYITVEGNLDGIVGIPKGDQNETKSHDN